MKRFICLFLCVSLLFQSAAQAFQYVETRPEAVAALESNGLGAVYAFLGADGGIRRMRVTGLETSPDGRGLIVKMERADSVIILDFESENEFTFRAQDTSGTNDGQSTDGVSDSSAPSANTVPAPPADDGLDFSSLGTGLSIGLGSAFAAGLQEGIIAGSGADEKIKRAFDRIAELEQEMGEEFNRIYEARLNARDQALLIVRKMENSKQPSAGPSSEIDSKYWKARVRYVTSQSQEFHGRSAPIQWLSTNENFLRDARAIDATLNSARIQDEVDQAFYTISKQALLAADQNSFLSQDDSAQFLLTIAKESADVLVGLDPFTGTTRSIYEAVMGTNIVTGEPLSDFERTMATIGIVTGGYAIAASKGFKLIHKLAKKIAPPTLKAFRSAMNFFKKTGNGFELVGDPSITRKVNFRSQHDPDWGLTPRHLKKHFFGNSKYALNKIDPGGNPDTWMQNLADLTQRQDSTTLANGAIDIHGIFSRADGSGSYSMGVRLWKNQDGTFDLITVLTKQIGK
ncbi:MAG: pre-toxin TG domain-containing protein [Bdellovibrionaceae bacterium]|nr:pre-toxin TG domain-containing protein [Pseudobdellovibrionaceae bacterium]